jgi:hypothetical protein
MADALRRAVSELSAVNLVLRPLIYTTGDVSVSPVLPDEENVLRCKLPILERNIRATEAALSQIAELREYQGLPTDWQQTVKSSCYILGELRYKYAISEYEKGKQGWKSWMGSIVNQLVGSKLYIELEGCQVVQNKDIESTLQKVQDVATAVSEQKTKQDQLARMSEKSTVSEVTVLHPKRIEKPAQEIVDVVPPLPSLETNNAVPERENAADDDGKTEDASGSLEEISSDAILLANDATPSAVVEDEKDIWQDAENDSSEMFTAPQMDVEEYPILLSTEVVQTSNVPIPESDKTSQKISEEAPTSEAEGREGLSSEKVNASETNGSKGLEIERKGSPSPSATEEHPLPLPTEVVQTGNVLITETEKTSPKIDEVVMTSEAGGREDLSPEKVITSETSDSKDSEIERKGSPSPSVTDDVPTISDSEVSFGPVPKTPKWVGRKWDYYSASSVGGRAEVTLTKFKTVVNHWERREEKGASHVIVEGLRLCLLGHKKAKGRRDYKGELEKHIEKLTPREQFNLYVLAKSERGFPEGKGLDFPEGKRQETKEFIRTIIEKSLVNGAKKELRAYLQENPEFLQGYEEITRLVDLP